MDGGLLPGFICRRHFDGAVAKNRLSRNALRLSQVDRVLTMALPTWRILTLIQRQFDEVFRFVLSGFCPLSPPFWGTLNRKSWLKVPPFWQGQFKVVVEKL